MYKKYVKESIKCFLSIKLQICNKCLRYIPVKRAKTDQTKKDNKGMIVYFSEKVVFGPLGKPFERERY